MPSQNAQVHRRNPRFCFTKVAVLPESQRFTHVNPKTSFVTGLCVIGVLLSTTRDATAYVDPGSSSYLFQLLVAGLTSLIFFFSAIRRQIGRVFRLLVRTKREPEPAPDAAARERL